MSQEPASTPVTPPALTRQQDWFRKLRLRVFGVIVGGSLAVVTALSVASIPVLPVVGVAVITVAALVNGMTSKLAEPACRTCGAPQTADAEVGVYGVICESCGAINEPVETSDRNRSRNA
ncbi:MAG: hypothetical protein AAGJ54_04385 [Planctomycetota bacterium]